MLYICRNWLGGIDMAAELTGTVGVSGITLGGGVGFLQRQYGLICDNLVEAQMVESFGNLITANSYKNKDLLEAL
jgi:FAD/FMN-containing dehydrogenase